MVPRAAVTSRVTRNEWLFLMAVFALGFFLRVYRLADQSLWLDEFITMMNLKAPDLRTDWSLMTLTAPEQSLGPIYYVFQYYWYHFVGSSVTILRLVSVCLSMITVIPLFWLGSTLYGRRAGLIAALLFSLSPMNIWVDQEVRAYPLAILLAAFSACGLVRGIYGQSRAWWAVHVAANVLLPWTHILTVFLFPAEGIFLLAVYRHRVRRAFAWGFLQLALLTPWAVWMSHMPYLCNAADQFEFSFLRVISSALFNDVVKTSPDLIPAWKTWASTRFLSDKEGLLAHRVWWDWGLRAAILIVVAAIATAVVRAIVDSVRHRPADPGRAARWERALFLLLMMFVPAVSLLLLEVVLKRSAAMPMYMMYNMFAVYIGFGALVSWMRRPWLRMCVLGIIVCLYGYQLIIFLPGATRSDWKTCAKYVEKHWTPGDVIFDVEYMAGPCFMKYYFAPEKFDVRRVTSFQAACDDSTRALADAAKANGPRRNVWIAFESELAAWVAHNEHYRYLDSLEQALRNRNIRFTLRIFPGHFNVMLLRLEPIENSMPCITQEPGPVLQPIDFEAVLREMDLSFPDSSAHAKAVKTLRRVISVWPTMMPLFEVFYAFEFLHEERPDLAAAMARHTVKRDPRFAMARMALGFALIAQGNLTEARQAFNAAFSSQRALGRLFGRFADACCEGKDKAEVELILEQMERIHEPLFAPAMRDVYRLRYGPVSHAKGLEPDGSARRNSARGRTED